MKILVTGFDPFGGESTNPSWEAVKLLPDNINGAEIIKMEIPTVFSKAGNLVIEKIEELNPDAVISIGQAGGRATITPEFIGINFVNARIPDNEGEEPIGNISEYGIDGIFSTLPVERMVERMKEENIPASISYTAGNFVCNHVLYSVLEYIKTNKLNTRSGFIHVPYIPSQVLDKPSNTPSMDLNLIVQGLKVSIEEVVEVLNIQIQIIENFELDFLVEELEREFGSDF
ncbi:MAG: pyroglutamyl-peptidase I [Tissierellia bacterium]|nr:pyroglutamyl-peptidase I [Tissierellia bacterium]